MVLSRAARLAEIGSSVYSVGNWKLKPAPLRFGGRVLNAACPRRAALSTDWRAPCRNRTRYQYTPARSPSSLLLPFLSPAFFSPPPPPALFYHSILYYIVLYSVLPRCFSLFERSSRLESRYTVDARSMHAQLLEDENRKQPTESGQRRRRRRATEGFGSDMDDGNGNSNKQQQQID